MNMLMEIKLYLFILSVIFQLKFVVEFLLKFTQETPSPIKISETEKIFLYLASAYTITYFLI
jgi:hypothetical protein